MGLLMAALSPFALYKFCTPDTPEAQAGMAIGLWGGIRALLIAVVITVIMEFAHVPGLFSKLSREALNQAFEALQEAFKTLFPEGKPRDAEKLINAALGTAAGKIGDAELYNTACAMEPRLWMCPWKGKFVTETAGHLSKIRLDVLLIKQALNGLNNGMEHMLELLSKVPEVAEMKKDLDLTMEDARELAIHLLEHDTGRFKGLDALDSIEGLKELDGYDDAVESTNNFVSFPEEVLDTMEDDEGVRLSIVYCMLQYLIEHVADITESGVQLS
jgi:hypothetical protein